MKKQLDIFIAFFRSSILGYGGGPSTIPLVHKEVVKRYKWVNDEEFGDILAIGNMLPGPIATKLSGYIGYRVGGFFGMINALVAATLPTIILMIILLTTLENFKDISWVKGMRNAVVPVVFVMLLTLTWQFLKSASSSLKWGITLIHVIVCGILLIYFSVHPAFVISGLLLLALLSPLDKLKMQKTRGKGNK